MGKDTCCCVGIIEVSVPGCMAANRYGKGLTPLAERLVVDLQTLSRSVRVSSELTMEWPKLEKQITKSVSQLTARQLAICLGSIARAPIVAPRRLVFLLTEKLVALESELTLKDYAVILNALAKLGIRNEIFLVQSLHPVIRKIKNSSCINLPAVVLVLDAYSRLGNYGDGTVLETAMAVLRDQKDELSGIDIVSILRAVSRLPNDIFSPEIVEAFLQKLTEIDDVNHSVSGLVALSKLQHAPSGSTNSVVKKVVNEFDSLSLPRKIQACSAISVLSPREAVSVIEKVIELIGNDPEILDKECANPHSAAILLLSAITKIHEQLRFVDIERVISLLQSVIPDDDPSGLSAIINLHSCVNLALNEGVRNRLTEIIDRGLLSDPQTVAVLVNALAKLEELELLASLFHLFPDQENVRTLVRGMSEQGQLMTLLGIVQLVDICRIPNSVWWMEELVNCLAVSRASPVESITQLRIIQSVVRTNPKFANLRGVFERIKVPPIQHGESKISKLQQQVVDAVTQLNVNRPRVNAVDPVTGYEIDILVDPFS